MSRKIRAGLVGVTGYTGMEMLRLIIGHGKITLTAATSRKSAGKTLAELFPHLSGFKLGALRVTVPDMDVLAKSCDLVFLAVPHTAAMDMASALVAKGVKVVDLSADYRLKDPDVYAEWYGTVHRHPQILPNAVYGLPELYREKIARALLTANPGCYPTSVILPLCPALENDLIDPDGIVADSKSGTTGAGRKAVLPTHFCEVSDSFRAYNLGKHRHTPEIEQELSLVAGRDLRISFNTHLLPMNRGILSTIYTRLKKDYSLGAIHSIYVKSFENEPWVRVLPKGILPETRWVRGSMFCDVGVAVDVRTNRLILVSAVDNLCRGASGQALANANIMCGLSMTFGLDTVPFMP